MAFRWKPLILAYCGLLPLPSLQAAPGQEEISRWVRQLGDAHFSDREAASRLLWTAGQVAEPALTEALKSSDPEVIRRAHEILAKFKFGIYPDTPEPIVKLVEQYRSGDSSNQQSAIQQLFKAGRPGFVVLGKLAGAEENPDLRRRLFQQIASQAAQLAETALADGDMEGAEELLQMCLTGSVDSAVRNYAAFFLLHGTLDAKIKQVQEHPGPLESKQEAEVLAYLYRANGDLAGALQAAEKAGKANLVEGILREQGDWKALAKALDKKTARTEAGTEPVSSGVKATCYRLAGNQPAFEEELQKGVQEGWPAALALFFNDRPDEAIKTFVRSQSYAEAFEFLTVRFKYRAAFELSEKSKAGMEKSTAFLLDVYRGRTLYQLGEKAQALKIFTGLAEQINDDSHGSLDGDLVETEFQLGLTDQAFEQCGRVLTRIKNEESPTWLLGRVFPKNANAAGVWLKYFRRKFAGEDAAVALKRVRAVLEGKAVVTDYPVLAGEVEKMARDYAAGEQVQWLEAIADTSLLRGQEDLARTFLKKATQVPGPAPGWNTSSWVRLGDFLAERKEWKEAAECYDKAWEPDHKQPLPLYLRGWTLTKLGRDREGQTLMDRAHWLPLANEALRYELAEALVKHGLEEAGRREREVILRTGEFQSVYVTNILNRIEGDALAHKDYLKAADCCQRVLLAVLQTGSTFIKNRAYVSVPAAIHRYKARGLVAGGRIDEARNEIQLCQAALPGDPELPILLIPELEKTGHRADADGLFAQVYEVQEGLCKDYPQSAWCHNTLAWLAARCRRQLNPALEHARKAVELAPGNGGFLDTQAEVYFQRGETVKAIDTMKKCISQEPTNTYFQNQLKRFQAGDPLAEIPPE